MIQRFQVPEKRSCCSLRQKEINQFAARGFACRGEDSELEEGLRARPRSDYSFTAVPLFPTVQAKLTVGPADDEYEREANLVANQVMSMTKQRENRTCSSCKKEETVQRAPIAAQIAPLVEWQAILEEEEEIKTKPLVPCAVAKGCQASPGLEQSLSQARGSGSPMAEGVRDRMENAFGVGFSAVRIHSDEQADKLNRSIQARAFTEGNDIFLRQGEYRPTSFEGQRLLAHELTHVVQQNKANPKTANNEIGSLISHSSRVIVDIKNKFDANPYIQAFWLLKNGVVRWEGETDNPSPENMYKKTGRKQWRHPHWWWPARFNELMDVWEKRRFRSKAGQQYSSPADSSSNEPSTSRESSTRKEIKLNKLSEYETVIINRRIGDMQNRSTDDIAKSLMNTIKNEGKCFTDNFITELKEYIDKQKKKQDVREQSETSSERESQAQQPLAGQIYSIENLIERDKFDNDEIGKILELINFWNYGERLHHFHKGVGGFPTMDLINFRGSHGRGNWRLQFLPQGQLRVVTHD